MLNRNFAATSKDLGRVNMTVEQPHFTKQQDWGQIMGQFLTDYKNQNNEKALAEALQSGDEEAINKAAAAYDPQAAMQERLSRMAEQRKFDQQKELLGIKNNYDAADFDRSAALAREIAQIKAGGNGLVNINMGASEEAPAVDKAQMGIDTLKDIADRNSIGSWTRFRNAAKLSSEQQEKDLGALSASIAAIAPQAIAGLKAAGVSGINTLGEFMQYIGLPENATSTQIKGALPLIAQILGKENPYGQQTANAQQTQVNYKDKYGLD